ncbi:MAG: XisI protein [Spirosomataceae bacterium]
MEEKIAKYQEVILTFLERQATYRVANSVLENQLVIDKPNGHFQLLRIGWRNNRFIHSCPFHFDIKNGKIWIQQNRTDVEVAEELVAMGVPPSDIVIGFLPVEMRAASGYAVA